jgi:hypothetical protein
MNNLFINPDNTNWQAQAVLACLRSKDGLESSWSKEHLCYMAEPNVNTWFNGSSNYQNCINIAFFEHRNSDHICAVMFEFNGINPPSFDDIPEEHPYYHSKYNYDHAVSYGEIVKMVDWIIDKLNEWWSNNN